MEDEGSTRLPAGSKVKVTLRRLAGSAARSVGVPTPGSRRRTLEVAAERPRWSACYAPHSSMYLDQHGKVRACCQNTGVYLGDVTTQSLREIWDSADAERMRTALEHDDYSAGCEFCEWQVREGNEAIVFARGFDELQPSEPRPAWPRQMEYSLTNTCNLQCVMCNGDWSSMIRSRREKRDPLPEVYGEAFFEQLAEFLPHLEAVEFLGGEPFLGREPLRVMEMLAELDRPPRVTITTNGTIYTPRVERILQALEPSIVVSLDGASTETYDAIRVGAHFPEVLANIDRFHAEVGPLRMSLTHCLMRSNWHEFADLLALAEERLLFTGVNVVRFPQSHSLYQLPADELAHVVETMQATEVHLTGQRLAQWTGQVAALAHRLEVVRTPHPELGPSFGLPGAPMDMAVREQAPAGGAAGLRVSRWSWLPFPEQADPGTPRATDDSDDEPGAQFSLDTAGIVRVQRVDEAVPFDLDDLDGAAFDALWARLESTFGSTAHWTAVERRHPEDDDLFRIRPGGPDAPAPVEPVGHAVRDDTGALVGGRFCLRPACG